MPRHYIQMRDKVSVYETDSTKNVVELLQDVKAAAWKDVALQSTVLEDMPEQCWEEAGLHRVKTIEPDEVEPEFLESGGKRLGMEIAPCIACRHCINELCPQCGGDEDSAGVASECHCFCSDGKLHRLYYERELLATCLLSDEDVPSETMIYPVYTILSTFPVKTAPVAYFIYEALKPHLKAIEKPEEMDEETFRSQFHYEHDPRWEEPCEIRDKAKNQELYDDYAIHGFPCHFFTMEAADKYNAKIEKYCKRLKEGARDLSWFQKMCRRLYIWYLDIYDGCLYLQQ